MKQTGWIRVKPKEFEELTFWLLHREGFYNVSWYGESGGDKGRDITCQRSDVLGPRVVIYNFIVQCKKYAGRVPRSRLYEDILKATEHHPDYFILATSGIVGSSTKDWLSSHQNSFGFRLVLWERTDLDVLLERHQDLRAKYLGIPMEPDLLLRQIASESHSLLAADKILLKPAVRHAIAAAYDLALKHSNVVTVGHLLTVLLREDHVCTRPLFISFGVEPGKLAKVLEDTFILQPVEISPRSEGIQPTASVRLAFETALRIMHLLRENILSERALIWALLVQQHSGTIEFLYKDCRIDRGRLMSILADKFFNKKDLAAFERFSLPYSSSRRSGLDVTGVFLAPIRSDAPIRGDSVFRSKQS